MTEKSIMREVMLAASKLGVRLLRNNCGHAWIGNAKRISAVQTVTVYPGDVVVRQARPIHFGLAVGSSDLIGWTPYSVSRTDADEGRVLAVFTAVETKSDTGRATQEQENFVEQVRKDGGIGVIAHSVDEAIAAIRARN